MTTQQQVNQTQYQNKSEAYLNSKVHAQGIEFKKMQNLIQQHQFKQVLDLGCGGGHVTYQIAAFTEQVIAYDITPEMVNLVTMQSQQKGFDHVIGQVGAAEQLDFPAEHFDCVISRYSAHHWQNITQALHEIYRVLRVNGKVIMFDIIGNANPILDTFIQTIETIRDPSHVRNYNLSEWMAFVEQAGFKIEIIEKQSLALNFQSWVERMQTLEKGIHTIRYLQSKISDQVRSYYQIKEDGTFTSEAVYLVLSKI
ncbi:class I SAM-dependent methyltransferase [Acinetobacter nematophilus]|uniref:class I SAM-dependent methyltransferase n=1 Tax=Acinetobacter nematophilus TaxID=2994642 RepID=UPI003AF88793